MLKKINQHSSILFKEKGIFNTTNSDLMMYSTYVFYARYHLTGFRIKNWRTVHGIVDFFTDFRGFPFL
jgi:hypothetical protein